LWRHGNEQGETTEGPVAVAWLPGANGATVTPLKEGEPELRLVLPPSISLKGNVTVGNVAPVGRPCRIRVLAACQDRGRLDDVLSIHVTAQEDGTFELAGLGPGKYQVQAALDDIWLSKTVSIEVGNTSLAPITLAIGQPGGPVLIKLVNGAGKPLPGKELTLDRPEGPLTKSLWPAVWKADGAGDVYIPALEAGRHTLRVNGAVREITARPLPIEKIEQVEIEVEAGRDK
jgi:hypothetical protein